MFIINFIKISPFEKDNIKMAKILTLLLLNKNGFEVGRFTSLGKMYDKKTESDFNMKLVNDDFEREFYILNKWLNYFLNIVLSGYEKLSEESKITINKRETKTRRIEKIINSTLGYFTKDDIKLQCPDIPEPTINRVFNNLRKDGKIEVIAKGRSAKWKKK